MGFGDRGDDGDVDRVRRVLREEMSSVHGVLDGLGDLEGGLGDGVVRGASKAQLTGSPDNQHQRGASRYIDQEQGKGMAPGPGPGPGPLRILDVYRTGEIRPTVPELLQMVDGLIDGGRASAAEVHYLRGVRAALEWVEGGGNPCGQIGVGKTRGGDDAR